MARHHGSQGQILIDPTGTIPGTPVAVASMNKWTLNMARDRVDVTAFGDVNKQYVQGLPDIKGTLGGWFDETDRTIFGIALGSTACALKLVPSSLAPTYYWQGAAYLDASIDVAANGAVSVSGSFAGAGPWTINPALP